MKNQNEIKHDVRGQLHALSAGIGALEANWETDPELCRRLLSLMNTRLNDLSVSLSDLHSLKPSLEN